jgi:phage-related holin
VFGGFSKFLLMDKILYFYIFDERFSRKVIENNADVGVEIPMA